MTRQEAVEIIEDFRKSGGKLFLDGCEGRLSDHDLIQIALLIAKAMDQPLKPVSAIANWDTVIGWIEGEK